jgi:hypothetical protein
MQETSDKTFSMREGWWYIGIKGGGGVKSKGTRLVIEKKKGNRPILAHTVKHDDMLI